MEQRISLWLNIVFHQQVGIFLWLEDFYITHYTFRLIADDSGANGN